MIFTKQLQIHHTTIGFLVLIVERFDNTYKGSRQGRGANPCLPYILAILSPPPNTRTWKVGSVSMQGWHRRAIYAILHYS